MAITASELKVIRKNRGFTQTEFAKRLGITRELLNKIETERLRVSRATELILKEYLKNENVSRETENFVNESPIAYKTVDQKDTLFEIQASLKIIIEELAKQKSKLYSRPVNECLFEMRQNIDIVYMELIKAKNDGNKPG